jgi:hypothetical protein
VLTRNLTRSGRNNNRKQTDSDINAVNHAYRHEP